MMTTTKQRVESVSGVRDRSSGLAKHYRDVRNLTEALAAPLSAEDQTVQSMPDASPTKWHRAHTTWFFETFVLVPHAPGYRRFDEALGFLFNSHASPSRLCDRRSSGEQRRVRGLHRGRRVPAARIVALSKDGTRP